MLAQALDVDPWTFQWHPEVWILVAFLTGAYVYMVRAIGPKAVPDGVPPVTRKNQVAFAFAMITLWVASDWPMHDISEEYLYSAHMLQHMMLSFFLPPLALLATPTWLMRVLVGDDKLYRAVRWMSKPVVAGVAFNVIVMITHIPLMVNASVESGPLHYSLHFLVVMLALLMWMPVCGPLPELQIGPLAKCIYLFLMSVVPTVPAAWLTFAEGTVYSAYEVPVRVFGLSIETDQQAVRSELFQDVCAVTTGADGSVDYDQARGKLESCDGFLQKDGAMSRFPPRMIIGRRRHRPDS